LEAKTAKCKCSLCSIGQKQIHIGGGKVVNCRAMLEAAKLNSCQVLEKQFLGAAMHN
jgi:hypothetical protein